MAPAGADVAILDSTTGRVEAIELPDVFQAPGTTTECVRVSSDGSCLYVATNGPAGGRLVEIGTSSTRSRNDGEQTRWRVGATVEVGLPIRDVALSPNDAFAYVASCAPEGGAVLDVMDTRTAKITGTRKIGEISGILTGLTLSGDGDRAYLVSDDGITVLCTLTHDVIGTVAVANQPSCAVESPDAKYLYIADYSGKVTVAPIASILGLTVHQGETAAEWVMPELLPALV